MEWFLAKSRSAGKPGGKVHTFSLAYAPQEEFFEFSIEKSEITNQTILVVKDFAEKKELKDQSMLWDYQVKDLFHRIGSN